MAMKSMQIQFTDEQISYLEERKKQSGVSVSSFIRLLLTQNMQGGNLGSIASGPARSQHIESNKVNAKASCSALDACVAILNSGIHITNKEFIYGVKGQLMLGNALTPKQIEALKKTYFRVFNHNVAFEDEDDTQAYGIEKGNEHLHLWRKASYARAALEFALELLYKVSGGEEDKAAFKSAITKMLSRLCIYGDNDDIPQDEFNKLMIMRKRFPLRVQLMGIPTNGNAQEVSMMLHKLLSIDSPNVNVYRSYLRACKNFPDIDYSLLDANSAEPYEFERLIRWLFKIEGLLYQKGLSAEDEDDNKSNEVTEN